MDGAGAGLVSWGRSGGHIEAVALRGAAIGRTVLVGHGRVRRPPGVAIGADGTVALAWESPALGSGRHLGEALLGVIGASPDALGRPFVVSRRLWAGSAVAVGADDRALFAWTDVRSRASRSSFRLLARTRRAREPIGPAQVVDAGRGIGGQPQLIARPAGGFAMLTADATGVRAFTAPAAGGFGPAQSIAGAPPYRYEPALTELVPGPSGGATALLWTQPAAGAADSPLLAADAP
jgi:hypothetical protein